MAKPVIISTADVTPTLPDPLPSSFMPGGEDLAEEGFGDFHESWWIGHVAVEEAAALVHDEAEAIEVLDRAAGSAEDFEVLALSLEDGETEGLSGVSCSPSRSPGWRSSLRLLTMPCYSAGSR